MPYRIKGKAHIPCLNQPKAGESSWRGTAHAQANVYVPCTNEGFYREERQMVTGIEKESANTHAFKQCPSNMSIGRGSNVNEMGTAHHPTMNESQPGTQNGKLNQPLEGNGMESATSACPNCHGNTTTTIYCLRRCCREVDVDTMVERWSRPACAS